MAERNLRATNLLQLTEQDDYFRAANLIDLHRPVRTHNKAAIRGRPTAICIVTILMGPKEMYCCVACGGA